MLSVTDEAQVPDPRTAPPPTRPLPDLPDEPTPVPIPADPPTPQPGDPGSGKAGTSVVELERSTVTGEIEPATDKSPTLPGTSDHPQPHVDEVAGAD